MKSQTVLTPTEGRVAVRGHNVIFVLGSSMALAILAGAAFVAAFHYGAF
jgi:hypothetical protein